jgi:heat shock protein HslJ
MIRGVVLALAAGAAMLAGGAAHAAKSFPLAGRTWQLVEVVGAHGNVSAVTVEFTRAGKVYGNSGCNSYSSTYTTSGSSFSVSRQLTTTLVDCGPVEVLETAYIKALESATRYEISGSRLTLKDSHGRPVATFMVQSQSLAGTRWTVRFSDSVSLIIGTKITANFDANGDLSGFSGCNDYTAAVKATPPRISIRPVLRTRRSCSTPAGVMEQEKTFLDALAGATTYHVEGTTLWLRYPNGTNAAFLAPA